MRDASVMEAVWRKRAERLSQRPVSSQIRQDAFAVLVLGIGKERYGIDLPDVAEVLPPIRPTPVPGAAALFAGVINVHGEIRPVIDLRRFLSMETEIGMVSGSALAPVILLRKDGRELGLRIDSVEQIRWVGSGELQPAGNGGAGAAPYMRGSTLDLLMLLSTEALLAELLTGVTN